MGLIGTGRWKPRGESMWSIGARLTALNHLTWTEFKCLFGAKGKQSFAAQRDRDPNAATTFSLLNLARRADWSRADLSDAFSDAYLPYWMQRAGAPDYACAGRLRVCPVCASDGVHLALHQLTVLTHCPLHEVRLTMSCPRCDHLFPTYDIHQLREITHNTCGTCRRPILNVMATPTNASVRQRERVLDEFHSWLTALERTLAPGQGRFAAVGLTQDHHLAHAHCLVPGPAWFNRCLEQATSIRIERHAFQGVALNRSDLSSSNDLSALTAPYLRSTHGTTSAPTLAYDLAQALSSRIRAVGTHVYNAIGYNPRHVGIATMDAERCGPVFGERISAWDTGYWLWRRAVDTAYPLQESRQRRRDPPPFWASWIWTSWLSDVGVHGWSPVRQPQQLHNRSFILWLTDIWTRVTFEELYGQFVGLACRAVGDSWLPVDALEFDADKLTTRSCWCVLTTDDGAHILRLSTIAPLQDFMTLHRSGFRGTDEQYLDDFDRLMPLTKLLGMAPAAVADWRTHWHQLRTWAA